MNTNFFEPSGKLFTLKELKAELTRRGFEVKRNGEEKGRKRYTVNCSQAELRNAASTINKEKGGSLEDFL